MNFRVASTKFNHPIRGCILVLTLAVSGTVGPFVLAERVEGSINGVVTDSSGAVVTGATVRAVEKTTGSARESQTTLEGRYDISPLRPGKYRLVFSSIGFRTMSFEVEVEPGAEQKQDAALQVGSTVETVEVTGTPISIDVETASIGFGIDGKQITRLPLVDNNIFSLASLQPGGQAISGSGSNASSFAGSYFSLGARARSNDLAIDGVESNDPFSNSFFQLSVGSGAPITTLPADAVQQFRVESQFTAQQGENSGALINLSTQSGTNNLHGSMFVELFNDVLNARNFFNRAPGPQAPLRHESFGGSVGLPVRRDHAFLFASYEGLRDSSAATFQSYLLNTQDLGIAVTEIGGPTQINPESIAVLDQLSIAQQRRTQVIISNSETFDTFFLRADYLPTQKDALSLGFHATSGARVLPLNSQVPTFRTSAHSNSRQVALKYSRTFSPQTTSTVQIGYNRFTTRLDPAVSNTALPLLKISGFSPLGLPTNVPSVRDPSRAIQLSGTAEHLGSRHHLSSGAEARFLSIDSSDDGPLRGAFLFDSLADFLVGRAAYARIVRGDVHRQTSTTLVSLYAQDSWTLSSKLTINPGLRWDLFTPIAERRNLLSTFAPNGPGLLQVGQSGVNSLYEPDLDNFGPRLGIAWDILGRQLFVMRGAYGIFYDTPPPDFFLAQTAPNTLTPGPAYNPVANNIVAAVTRTDFVWQAGRPAFGLDNGPPFDLFIADRNIRTPRTQSYNLTASVHPATKALLEFSYAGSVGGRLFRIRDINQSSPGSPDTAQLRRPFSNIFPEFAVINRLETSASSSYNALLTSLQVRHWHNLDFRATYSLSHSIDDASDGIDFNPGVAFPQDSRSLVGERASSTFDARHRFTLSAQYESPQKTKLRGLLGFISKRWTVSGLMVLQSGHPFSVATLSNPSGTNEFSDRPDLIGSPLPKIQNADNFLNFPAFSQLFVNRFGTLPRNAVVGAGLADVDVTLARNIKISENTSVQFRVAAFNLFNHPNLALPNQFLSDGRGVFGAVSSTTDMADGVLRLGSAGARQIQLELKFNF